jgi:uncharacterized protein
MSDFISQLLRVLLRAYQYVFRPLLGVRCRYLPSCSDYMLEAVQTRGPLTGVYLGSKRLLRCHPWCDGGYDPVPTSPTSQHATHPL